MRRQRRVTSKTHTGRQRFPVAGARGSGHITGMISTSRVLRCVLAGVVVAAMLPAARPTCASTSAYARLSSTVLTPLLPGTSGTSGESARRLSILPIVSLLAGHGKAQARNQLSGRRQQAMGRRNWRSKRPAPGTREPRELVHPRKTGILGVARRALTGKSRVAAKRARPPANLSDSTEERRPISLEFWQTDGHTESLAYHDRRRSGGHPRDRSAPGADL